MDEDKPKWRVDRKIGIDSIFSILAAVIIALSSYFVLVNRVSLVEQAMAAHQRDDDRDGTRTEDQLRRLNEKMDKLLDRTK